MKEAEARPGRAVRGAWLALLALLLVLPWLGFGDYPLHLMVVALIWSYIYTSWAIMGRLGMVSFGHGAFMGIGAYSVVLLWNLHGITPWLGIPLGVATQFLLIPLLYLPLRELWPDTFDPDRLEERARELADKAGGFDTVLLVVVVVVGAPLIEELVYRGLLQRSLSVTVGASSGLLLTSILFSLIHFSPIEYPGLLVAGLVFGACVTLTGRLGPAIVTHAAFNAAGLVTVLWL